MLLKKKWRTEGRGHSSKSDGQREANTGPENSSQPHNLTPDWVFLKWKLLNLTIAEWWQPRKFILWIKVWIHATLKWCRYFFNLKPSALKYISIKAIEVYENSMYLKCLGHTAQNPFWRSRIEPKVTCFTPPAIEWQIQDQNPDLFTLSVALTPLSHNGTHFCFLKEASAWPTVLTQGQAAV